MKKILIGGSPCTHWSVIQNAKNREICLQDVLEYGETDRKKSKTVRVGGSGSGWGNKHEWDMPNKDRVYTTTELERLQTLPDGYTRGIPERQRRKSLGNGWTAEVIIELMQHMNIDKDEEIIVVSLYDGIATGRYCLEKLGFTNVKYFAFEIDKYAMQVAVNNYPDIIECGDAFKVRAEKWCIEEELEQDAGD